VKGRRSAHTMLSQTPAKRSSLDIPEGMRRLSQKRRLCVGPNAGREPIQAMDFDYIFALDSALTEAASGRSGVRAKAAVPYQTRNRGHRRKYACHRSLRPSRRAAEIASSPKSPHFSGSQREDAVPRYHSRIAGIDSPLRYVIPISPWGISPDILC
jgi:hypothetical protein